MPSLGAPLRAPLRTAFKGARKVALRCAPRGAHRGALMGALRGALRGAPEGAPKGARRVALRGALRAAPRGALKGWLAGWPVDPGNGQKWHERVREGSIWPDPAGKRNCRTGRGHPDGFRAVTRPFRVGFSDFPPGAKRLEPAGWRNLSAATAEGLRNGLGRISCRSLSTLVDPGHLGNLSSKAGSWKRIPWDATAKGAP